MALTITFPVCVLILISGTNTFDLQDLTNGLVNSIGSTVEKLKEWERDLQLWSDENWDCGADKFWITKLATKTTAIGRCPTVIDQINSACRWHDICYSQGAESQTNCDNRFCDSLLSLVFTDPNESQTCFLPQVMCEAVRIGGALVYTDRRNQQ